MIGFYGQKKELSFLYVPLNIFSYTINEKGEDYTKIIWDDHSIYRIARLMEKGVLSKKRLEQKDWTISEAEIPRCLISQFSVYKKTCDFRAFDCAMEILEYTEQVLNVRDASLNWDDEDCDYDEIEDYIEGWWLRGEDPPAIDL